MEFSEDFKWTGFLYTFNWGVLAVRNELEFCVAQGSFILGFSG